MLHPHTRIEYFNDEIGHGIVATRFIPKGTVTWCLDKLDRFATAEQMQTLDPLLYESAFHYAYRNKRGEFVLLWDATRFMNHSYDPNCLITPYNLEIAVRDIHIGEELTCDYGTLNIVEPFDYPGAPDGRKGVTPDDLTLYYSMWDKQIESALTHFSSVKQPLASLISPQIQKKLQAIIQNQQASESILSLYFHKEPSTLK